MHTELMMDQVMLEAVPWLLWSVGFAVVYIIASLADDAKRGVKE